MSSKISFGFKKQAEIKSANPVKGSKNDPKNPQSTSKINSIFESHSTRSLDDDVKSYSFVTSLGSEGFEGKTIESVSIKRIECPKRLPSPIRGKGEWKEIVPQRNTKKIIQKKTIDKKTVDKDQYGLINPKNNQETIEDNEELGPPRTVPVTEGDLEVLLKGHRGVIGSRRLNNDNTTESELRYDLIPIEEFGLAMLMGMGYSPNALIDNQPLELKRRAYAKAGLGADKEFEKNDNHQSIEKKNQRL